ncbi:Pectin lyase-like superfamily protein [Quillaja saponaria]|uniref:Pectin lyase-like superfamily protein n=1 Tax=Quillaja saponaria TaxID=32244 RepID=A0AAD7KSJ6_QUISA|nr:Pectin lyase-like superfamily protein [Quillaja saponaria]
MESEKAFIGGALIGNVIRFRWTLLLLVFTLITVLSLQLSTREVFPIWVISASSKPDVLGEICVGFFQGVPRRKVVRSIKDFGGVGDGKTSNTESFRRAIKFMQLFGEKGGSQLNIPKGRWVTGSFNLTSNFTLFLEEGAVILGSQDIKQWPIIEPLPSYGRGRERLGGRHISLIHGNGLHNVVITGQNGTVDGQGKMWWELWWNRTLVHTRGHLLELINSHNILISNLTFLNSPFWTIHPVYCSNVVIKGMTILAPLDAPNTDGIDPGLYCLSFIRCILFILLCFWVYLDWRERKLRGENTIKFLTLVPNVCIEDCYIESGDDLVAVKSGWDQYGITMARPSTNIIVRRVSGTTPTCSGVGIGSEMSGGIANIKVENLHIRDSAAGVRIKSDKGRGGYIANVSISNILMERVKIPIRFSRGSNDHPDEGWDPKAVPKVKGISISHIVSVNSTKAPVLQGIENALFEGICLRNVTLLGLSTSATWHCEYVSGFASGVFPVPCPQLQQNDTASWCPSS